MDFAGSAVDTGPVLPDFRRCAFASPCRGTKSVHQEESYVDALVTASLQLMRKGLPVEVQCHGVRMLLHLLCFRNEELSTTKVADLRKVLGSLDDMVLKDATHLFDGPTESTVNHKERNQHMRCLLVVLAARKTNTVENDKAGGEGSLNLPSNISTNSEWSSGRTSRIWIETYSSSLPENYGFVRFMSCQYRIGDLVNISNACEEFAEVAEPAMRANGEMMSCHQGQGRLIMEHNIICQAFLILISYSGIQQYKEILPCLLSLLNKIWTLPDWRTKYLHHESGLTCLFSDSQFLKMVYYLFRFCEMELKRSRFEVLAGLKYCEHYILTILPLILPLLLELLQCIHGLWCPSDTYNVKQVLERAKLFSTMDEEGSQEKETTTLIEGIRESGYKVIGLCASIEGAFPWLLNGSIYVALSKYLDSLDTKHLGKLIKHTVIPLIKNCPCEFWEELVDVFLQHLLRCCGNILFQSWFRLLYHGCAGVPHYFGELCGLEGTMNALNRDILLEFTRDFSGLLEVVALPEQNRALSLLDVTQDIDSIRLTSLFRYLVMNGVFGTLRMSLFGYFVDDTATAKAIPFCRALVCHAMDSKDARLRVFIMDNLLPCVIQRLDDKLPCAIWRLKCELNSSASNVSCDKLNTTNNVHRGLVALCEELYTCAYVQNQALLSDRNSCNAETSFEVWLRCQKENFRAKSYSATAKVPLGNPWHWELEYECERYLSAYIDMLRVLDETDHFAEHIDVDDESLFQKLSPALRSNYAINSCAHPYLMISFRQRRKFYSMSDVIRNRKIRNLVHKLIKLKPYIKGSDRAYDVVSRLKRTSQIPPELSKYVTPSVGLLLRSVLYFWEPTFHPMIRQVNMERLLDVVDGLMAKEECLEPVVPLVRDFPPHLQPYAHALIKSKFEESKYYVAVKQIRLHEQFDEFLASGKLDCDVYPFMFSKDTLPVQTDEGSMEVVVNKVPRKFWELEPALRKLSFERRADIVHLETEICTYLECLQGLFASEDLKVEAQSLMSELEAEGFFHDDSSQIDWGKTSFSELIDKFNSKVLLGNSLPKHYAIRGIIDCRAILLQNNINHQEALEKVVVDIRNRLTEYLPKFWNDSRSYKHMYYDIIRDPLRLVNWGPRTQAFEDHHQKKATIT